MLELEQRRQEWEARLEQERKDFDLRLNEISERRERRDQRVNWFLGFVGAALALAQVLTATPDSWIATHSPVPLFGQPGQSIPGYSK